MPSSKQLLSCILSSFLPTLTHSHGFLSTPRSRNLVAYEDRLYHNEQTDTPFPEDCPTCLNRGGTLARCGVLNPGKGGAEERNYDFPINYNGDPMPNNPQNSYVEGATIDIEVVLSAHHKGHFIFKACPIPFTTISPTQECFDQHPLLFVEDKLYGAPVDVNHPERAYVAPATIESKMYSDKPNFDQAMLFEFKMKLPEGVSGDLVLIQWYYVAGNSGCAHAGYDTYQWPKHWIKNMDSDEGISEWESKVSVGTGLKSCEDAGALPEDGNGVPEQFWNCAEVSIVPASELSPSQKPGQLQSDKVIIGYWASWQWYDRKQLADPEVFDYRKYTRINFAFFQTNEKGDLWGTDAWADPIVLFGPHNWVGQEGVDKIYCSWDAPPPKTEKNCNFHHYEKGLLHLARAAGAEVWPSIGGWSLSDPFPVMAKNQQSRENFARNCIRLIQEYGFDGIDIDWEYPGYEAHSGTPDDTESYNLLLRDLRQKLDELGDETGKFYGLTAALPCGTNHIGNIDIPTAAKYLTELNLMTYDFFGSWSPTTGVNAPLYDQDWGGDDVMRYSIDGCVKNWVEGGGKPSQVNIGLPFYGRGYEKAKHFNETHTGKPDKTMWWQDEGSPQYFNIINKLPELVSVRHELTATQYAYNPAVVQDVAVGGMISYDDEEAICDKTEYAMDHNLNGFIIWEISGDLMDDLSTPLIDAVHAKLSDPTFDCIDFRYDQNTFAGYATPLGNEFSALIQREKTADDEGLGGVPAKQMTCPTEWYWGTLQWDQCRSYFRCTNGAPDTSTLTECPEGQLFDEISGLCKDNELVTCSEVADPTPSPITPFTAECAAGLSGYVAGPDCSFYYRCQDGVLVSEPILCSPGTLFDEGFSKCNDASKVTCSELATDPLGKPADSVEYNYKPYCPTDVSAFMPGPDCLSYYHCHNGVIVSDPPIRSCPPGTLFDERISICNLAETVECTVEISAFSENPVSKQPTAKPTPYPSPPPNTPPPVTNEPTAKPTHYPTPRPSSETSQKIIMSSPTFPSYEIIHSESESNAMAIVLKPTKKPTKKPKKTPLPTPRPAPGNPANDGGTLASSFLQANPNPASSNLASSFLNGRPNTSFTTKGEETTGDKIKNQIQLHAKKKDKKGKRGKAKTKKNNNKKKKKRSSKSEKSASSKSMKKRKTKQSSKSKKQKRKDQKPIDLESLYPNRGDI